MTITTLDGALAGFQAGRAFSKALSGTLVAGRPYTYWATAGNPGAGSYDTTLNGVTLSSSSSQVAGQIPHTDPGSGNAYLARFQGVATQAGVLVLADRLWHNGGFTITSNTAQNITSPTWPARDNAGATSGDGVLVGLEVSATVGAATPTLTLGYTNSAGTASRSGTNIIATASGATAGTFYEIGLQAGDKGVQSVQSLTLSASWVSGTINLVAYRVLARLEIPGALIPNALDVLTSGMPQIFNGTVPYMWFIPNTTTSSIISGHYMETQG